jgi:hypothetical protein
VPPLVQISHLLPLGLCLCNVFFPWPYSLGSSLDLLSLPVSLSLRTTGDFPTKGVRLTLTR